MGEGENFFSHYPVDLAVNYIEIGRENAHPRAPRLRPDQPQARRGGREERGPAEARRLLRPPARPGGGQGGRVPEGPSRTPQVAVYADYREMLAKEKPDICAIATESGYHPRHLDRVFGSRRPCNLRKAHGPVHRGRRRHDRGRPQGGPEAGGLLPEPVQRPGAAHARRPGSRALWPHAPRHGPGAVEPQRGLLRRGPLARHLGPGRRHPDEPVHPRDRPFAMDDGRGRRARPGPDAPLPAAHRGGGLRRGHRGVRLRGGGDHRGHRGHLPDQPQRDPVPVRGEGAAS